MKCQDPLLSAHLFSIRLKDLSFDVIALCTGDGVLALAAPRCRGTHQSVYRNSSARVLKSCFPVDSEQATECKCKRCKMNSITRIFAFRLLASVSYIRFYQCRRHTANHALEIHSLAVSHQPTASSTVLGIVFFFLSSLLI